MIRFIGSVYFTLILIAAVALIAIAGTFLESYSSSHLFAAKLTYGNPFFGMLLYFFFLNILVSTLLRWPFKVKHIPFIITHFGLLMILGGQLVKHYYGIQGVMQIAEGCSSCEYFTEHSQALQITEKNGAVTYIPIVNQQLAPSSFPLRLAGYHPNGSEIFSAWIREGILRISGLPPLPVTSWKPSQHIPQGFFVRLHHAASHPWHIFAVQTDDVEALLHDLAPKQPYLLFLDQEAPEAIWVSHGGRIHRQDLNPEASVAMYDGGFGGYSSVMEVPFSNLPDTPEAQHEALLHAVTVQMKLQSGLDPNTLAQSGKEALLQDYYAACLFDKNVHAALSKLSKLSWDEKIAFLQSFPLDAEELAGLQKAYLGYLQATNPSHLAPDSFVPSLGEILEAIDVLLPVRTTNFSVSSADFSKEKPHIESPLTAIRKAEPTKLKTEDHRPIALFEIQDPSDRFALVFDRFGTGLQWPVAKGSLLARFQPLFHSLPHTIKLRQARQINYPGASQAYSYEADLWIEPKHELVTLSMNQVHETEDGYRFYLSGIAPADPGAWKKIQLVVNRDPAKYWLTYPGAVLLVIGASLLFFYSKKR